MLELIRSLNPVVVTACTLGWLAMFEVYKASVDHKLGRVDDAVYRMLRAIAHGIGILVVLLLERVIHNAS